MNKQNVIYLPVSVSEKPFQEGELVTAVFGDHPQGIFTGRVEGCRIWGDGDKSMDNSWDINWFSHRLEPITDQYIFTRDQLAEYLANYSFHMSGAYNKNNAEKYIEGDWRNYVNLEETKKP